MLVTLFDELYETLKNGESVTIRNFASVYVYIRRRGTLFRFNAIQKLRALFGGSSKTKGAL